MVLFPDVQRAAQDELDRVIGRERLPEMQDRDSLVYVSALVQEVLRSFIRCSLRTIYLKLNIGFVDGIRWHL